MILWFRNNLSNLLTCLNLACGVLSIFLLSTQGTIAIGQVEILILIAGIADFFDGFVARLLGSTSKIGKDLDSLADSVTFGVLPSLVVFLFLRERFMHNEQNENFALVAILISIFSSVRLAIFNNDTRQTDSFIGVPTPANTFFIVFLIGSFHRGDFLFLENAYFISAIALISSAWLVAPIPLIALKFKNYDLKANLLRYTLLLSGLVFLIFLGLSAIPSIFLVYLAVSFLNNILSKQ